MDTLLMNIESLERAQEFAARCNESAVWRSGEAEDTLLRSALTTAARRTRQIEGLEF